MIFRIFTIAFMALVVFPSAAQEFEIRSIGFASPVENMTFAVDPDAVGPAVFGRRCLQMLF